jgi:hypothetical protein
MAVPELFVTPNAVEMPTGVVIVAPGIRPDAYGVALNAWRGERVVYVPPPAARTPISIQRACPWYAVAPKSSVTANSPPLTVWLSMVRVEPTCTPPEEASYSLNWKS